MTLALVPYFVTFNNDTVLADRFIRIEAATYLEAWDRLERQFQRTFTLYGEAGWKNWQGLTVAQRQNLREIGWNEAVRIWVHPPLAPSPYKED